MNSTPPSAEEGRTISTQIKGEEETMAGMFELFEKTLGKISDDIKWKSAYESYVGSICGYDLTMAEVLGMDKWQEIHDNLWGEGGKFTYPQVKEAFNITVENAIDAANLAAIVATLGHGPRYETEVIEETPKRAVYRYTKCPWWDTYQAFGAKPEHIVCHGGHDRFVGDGITAVNPKIKHKLVKSMPRGDPYCEVIFELEE
jgi:hypothetical protein